MRFIPGETYSTTSICDADMVISVTIAKRTAKRITTTEGKTLGISIYEGIEQIRPWGRYSMAPIIAADDIVKQKQPTLIEPIYSFPSNVYNISDYRK